MIIERGVILLFLDKEIVLWFLSKFYEFYV